MEPAGVAGDAPRRRRRLANDSPRRLLVFALCAGSAHAERRYIVRDILGLSSLNLSCLLLGCSVERALGDPLGQVFLITTPLGIDLLPLAGGLLRSSASCTSKWTSSRR